MTKNTNKPITAEMRREWQKPFVLDLDADTSDVENGGGSNSDGAGRTTS